MTENSVNPYVLEFGQIPIENINRASETENITNIFLNPTITQHIYLITGIRGSGKTVFLTTLERKIASNDNWVVVRVNGSSESCFKQLKDNMMGSVALAKELKFSSFSFSIAGFNVSFEKNKYSSEEVLIRDLLKKFKEHNKRLLITVDEVTNTSYIKELMSAFQNWLSEDLPVFMLATGLQEKILEMQNVENLTFLYRAPKIYLSPLNFAYMSSNYEKTLEVSNSIANKLASLTKGYSFAFQALGNAMWESKEISDEIIEKYKNTLFNMSYDKIWAELTDNEKTLAIGIARTKSNRYKDIGETIKWSADQMNPYRKRLIDKMVVVSETRGCLSFSLPMFREFILNQVENDNEWSF